jgi:hypothetical protein
MLQTALQKVIKTPNKRENDVAALIQEMNVINVDITFHQHEFPPLDMQKRNDAFVIIENIRKKG